MPQTVLPGRRTSAVVARGTSPVEAAAAARASQEYVKAPSAKGGKGGGKAKGKGGGHDDYDEGGFGAGGEEAIAGVGDLPGKGEGEPGRLVAKGERADGKYQDANGAWHDANNRGRFCAEPPREIGAEPMLAVAQAEVLAKYKPGPALEAEMKFDANLGHEKARVPKGPGNLIDKFRAVFAKDSHPDTLMDDTTKGEQESRNAYMEESQRVAETTRASGRPRTSTGQWASRVTVTTHGAVQLRGKGGQIRETLRAPYREGASGLIRGNIEPPMTRDTSRLREVVDGRLERMGTSLFQDRAALSPRRLAAMRIAFALDRKERGWPVPDWGLTLD
jgi:hypothetical protein